MKTLKQLVVLGLVLLILLGLFISCNDELRLEEICSISVEGVVVVGETLTVEVMPSRAPVSYQWLRSNSADGTYANISGATNKTYKLVEADKGKWIKVEVKGTGNFTGTESKIVGPVTQIIQIINERSSRAYDTIQEAVAEAIAGDTILVGTGTYVEEGQIVIAKNLTIKGNSKEGTIIKPKQDTGSDGDDRGWILVEANVEFNLSNVTLDGEGKAIYQAVRSYGTGSVDDSIIKNIKWTDNYGAGLVFMGTSSDFTVSNTLFENIDRNGIVVYGTGITGGTIDNNTFIGRNSEADLEYGIEISEGATDVEVKNNKLRGYGGGNDDYSSAAISIVSRHDTTATTVTITNNVVKENYIGIAIGNVYDKKIPQVTVTDNEFENNTYHIFDDRLNWDSDNGELLNSIMVDNEFAPESGIGDGVIRATKEGDILNLNQNRRKIYSSIQEAVNKAYAYDDISVSAGTYEENVTIATNGLTLKGPNAGIPYNGERVDEAIVVGSFNLTGDNITIEGFTIEHGESTLNNKRGIYINSIATKNSKIANNILDGGGKATDGIFVSGEGTLIEGNKIFGGLGSGNGFWTQPSGDLTVEGNSVEGYGSSMYFDSGSTGDFEIIIKDNIFSPSEGHGISIEGNPNFDGYTFSITGNTFEDTGATIIRDLHSTTTANRDGNWRASILDNNTIPEGHVWYDDGQTPPLWLLAENRDDNP